VRSDRLFCERLEYDLLFRWFLDMDVEESGFDASTFSKNRGRLMEHEVAPKFFAEVVALARGARLLDDEHFTVDGTLIEAWASAKSFRPKSDLGQPPDDNFHGQARRNDTHQSTTDGDARLMRKGNGKEARLSFGAHALMDGRHGLCADLSVTLATESEPQAAVTMLERRPIAVTTVAAWSIGAGRIRSGLMSPRSITARCPDSMPARCARKLTDEASTSGAASNASSAGAKAWAVCARPATEDCPASPSTPNSSPPPIICCASPI